MKRNRPKHSSASLYYPPLFFFFKAVKQRESSLKESAFPFIKQTSEWPFVDEMFQSFSPGRASLTPGQQPSQHAGATLQEHPGAAAALAPHHPLVDLKFHTSLKEIYIQVDGYIPTD